MEDKSTIIITQPSGDCPIISSRPSIAWDIQHPKPESLRYTVRIVPLKEGEDASKALDKGRLAVEEHTVGRRSLRFPSDVCSLRSGAYAVQVLAHDKRNAEIAISRPGLMYVEPDNLPVSLSDLLCCNDILAEKWRVAYGTPSIQPNAAGALPKTSTLITLKGNFESGDAVWNGPNSGFERGKRYAIRLSARLLPKDAKYVRLRIIAFNGALPTTGQHPPLGSDLAVVSESGRISQQVWNRILLPSWRASKNYENIAILAFTDEDTERRLGFAEVADICVSVTDNCGPFVDVLRANGSVSIPQAWKDHVDPASEPDTVDVDFQQGAMQDLYGPMFDALGNSNWYFRDECASFGGVIPPEANELIDDFQDVTIDGISPQDVHEGMLKVFDQLEGFGEFDHLKPLEPDNGAKCAPPDLDKALPFAGRDIVYVHGFWPPHIFAAIEATMNNTPTDALKAWPTDAEEFEDGGEFRENARTYWREHINEYLLSTNGPSNRHLTVGYNSNQRLIECAHAILGQISKAMNSGEGVVPSVNNPNKDCFGRELVIVTHSTGALVADVAMTLAARTADDPQLREMFGDISHIPKRTRIHVSLHGAIAGSEIASLAVVGANLLAVFAPIADIAVDVGITINNVDPALSLIRQGLTGFGINVAGIEAFLDAATDTLAAFASAAVRVVNRSVLIDLSPPVAKLLWGATLNDTPVPVLTVAGGHPTPPSITNTLAKPVLPGFDDGIVNTNSQSASPSLLHPDLFGYIPPATRLFDMGRAVDRSAVYFAEQFQGPALAAYGSIPQLSPTGMLQPVDVVPSPSPRFQNHFTLLQSASDHNHPKNMPGDNYVPTPAGNSNFEETLVVDRPEPFTQGLVNPQIAQAVVARALGQDLIITLNVPIPVFSLLPPSVTITTLTITVVIPLWRRSYRNLVSDTAQHECDYVYEFVLR